MTLALVSKLDLGWIRRMHKRRSSDAIMQTHPVHIKSSETPDGPDMEICVLHKTDIQVKAFESLDALPPQNTSAADKQELVEQHPPDERPSRAEFAARSGLAGGLFEKLTLMSELTSGPVPKGSIRPKRMPASG